MPTSIVRRWLPTWLTIAAVITGATTAQAGVTIVVNFGDYRSAEAAASSEKAVNWLDADVTDDTVCTQCFAAVELQKYLRCVTGKKEDFAIADDESPPSGEWIVVGGPASNALARALAAPLGIDEKSLAALGREGYRIKTAQVEGRRVTLVAGGSRVGTLYGAYDLLHRLGVRWFAPERDHEEVPSGDWQPLFDVTERPSFATRGFYIYQKRGGPEFWLWMARNRLNDWNVESNNPSLLRKLGFQLSCGTHDAQWLFLNPHERSHAGERTRFELHPEWYAEVGGKRIPGIDQFGGTNFCTSNREAVGEFTRAYVQALIDGRYAGADIVNFWTLDGGKWCECDRCKTLGIPTDRNLRLVYEFDREIKKAQRAGRVNRPVAVRFLVYADVLAPPTRPLPEDFDYGTCVATFYPISRCFVHPFGDTACPRNVAYQRKLHGWAVDPSRHYQGQLVIGEYYNVSRYKSLPLCVMHTMASDIPRYHKLGARFFQYMHVTTGRWGNKALTNYQMARQLWNVDTDCEAIWTDYFARRYGPAAPPMREFYVTLERMLSNIEPLKGWSNNLASRLHQGSAELFNENHLRYQKAPGVAADAPTLVEMVAHGHRCRELIAEAIKVPTPARIHSRILEDERQFTYGERTLGYYDACAQAFEHARAGRLADSRRFYAEAKRLAELLRQDTWSLALAFEHDEPFELNAFNATYATGALEHLAKLLGESKAEPVRK